MSSSNPGGLPGPHCPELESELPRQRPDRISRVQMLGLRHNPPRMGRWAMERRRELFGDDALLCPTPTLGAVPEGPALLRGDALDPLQNWPEPGHWRAGDRLLLPVPATDEGAQRYTEWLLELAAAAEKDGFLGSARPGEAPSALAPFSPEPGGTHRLWIIAVARLVLPAQIRVEARHDLIGIRLAQVALGFGADTLSGPIEPERRLPVAGVTRPSEASLAGLRTLIEQAGLRCVLPPTKDPR